MKRILALFLAMAIVMCCVGCGASNSSADTVTTEAIVTETQPQETETVIQESTEAEVIEEVADEYVMTNLGSGAKAEEYFPEVIDLRMYAPKNGYTRFEVDYKAPEGLRPVAVAYVAEEHVKAPEGIVTDAVTYVKDKQQASYWHEAEEKTTGEEQTFAFEIETDVLEESNGPEIHFCDENYESMSWLLIYHTQYANQVTDGKPVGDMKVLKTSSQGDIKAHSVTTQALDNGYVRFIIDYTTPANRYISLYNAPSGNRFWRYTLEPTTGEREVIVMDIEQDKLEGQTNLIVSSYEYFWENFMEDNSRIFVEMIG